jgi:type VI secretion system protein ImpA
VVKELAGDKIPKQATVAASAEGSQDAATANSDAAGGANPAEAAGARDGAIRGREDALRRLEQIADYFRTNEPQSFIPYALEQIVVWGRMPLPQLLAELIPEEASRKGLFSKVGIKQVQS